MGDLTLRDEHMIALGDQAEAYVEHHAHQQHDSGGSLSRSNYDVEGSRAEWSNSVQ